MLILVYWLFICQADRAKLQLNANAALCQLLLLSPSLVAKNTFMQLQVNYSDSYCNFYFCCCCLLWTKFWTCIFFYLTAFRYESVIATLCENLDSLDEPEARAAMIWIVGEYAERIDNADELLESFLEGFHDESTQVCFRLQRFHF